MLYVNIFLKMEKIGKKTDQNFQKPQPVEKYPHLD